MTQKKITRILPQNGENLGRYKIIEKLGEGGMGQVYLAYDPQVKRQVALKVISAQGNEQAAKRFVREAEAIATLKHPNIVEVFATELEGYTPHLSMQYIPGLSLDQYIAKHKPTMLQKVQIILEIARALAHAHRQNILHRDIK